LNFLDRRAFCDWCDKFEFRGSSKHPDQLLNEGLAALRCAALFVALLCSVQEQLTAMSGQLLQSVNWSDVWSGMERTNVVCIELGLM
jgi:hypothetical protein